MAPEASGLVAQSLMRASLSGYRLSWQALTLLVDVANCSRSALIRGQGDEWLVAHLTCCQSFVKEVCSHSSHFSCLTFLTVSWASLRTGNIYCTYLLCHLSPLFHVVPWIFVTPTRVFGIVGLEAARFRAFPNLPPAHLHCQKDIACEAQGQGILFFQLIWSTFHLGLWCGTWAGPAS